MSTIQKITEAQMDANGVCSAPNVLNGTVAQNKAVFDKMVRQLVAPAYNAAVDAIDAINATETGIEAAETQRVVAEDGRVTTEQGRVSAEANRVAAESTRASTEGQRAAAETTRATAETGRVSSEGSRVGAETGRVNAESGRVAAENQRAAAETERANETTGIVAQATAQANQAATSAYSAAESAERAEQAVLGQIPEHSITPQKLAQQYLQAVAAAADYDPTATYTVGAYRTKDGKLYKCTTAITAAEAWTAAHWAETSVGAEIAAAYTALAAHTGNASNPHGVTPAQIGAATTKLLYCTVPISWTAVAGGFYTQTVSVPGILATDEDMKVDIYPGSDNAANKLYVGALSSVQTMETLTDAIKFVCTSAPTVAFPLKLEVTR